ncbi:MAG: hypothetical protein R6V01_09605 [Thermoplasmatota archaeon]
MKKRPKLVLFFRSLFSGVFMTAGIFLVLWALGELFVRLLDGKNSGSYIDWGMVPVLLALASIPFFILYIVINYDRIRLTRALLDRIGKDKAPREIETVELD